eukprot:Hpha_TRINITY_DN8437_c0_g1::TRINITY_DN8437_c0_g1_i1::g.34763::m.34763
MLPGVLGDGELLIAFGVHHPRLATHQSELAMDFALSLVSLSTRDNTDARPLNASDTKSNPLDPLPVTPKHAHQNLNVVNRCGVFGAITEGPCLVGTMGGVRSNKELTMVGDHRKDISRMFEVLTDYTAWLPDVRVITAKSDRLEQMYDLVPVDVCRLNLVASHSGLLYGNKEPARVRSVAMYGVIGKLNCENAEWMYQLEIRYQKTQALFEAFVAFARGDNFQAKKQAVIATTQGSNCHMAAAEHLLMLINYSQAAQVAGVQGHRAEAQGHRNSLLISRKLGGRRETPSRASMSTAHTPTYTDDSSTVASAQESGVASDAESDANLPMNVNENGVPVLGHSVLGHSGVNFS